MTQHPEEGTLHAYIDGELPRAEAAALELHVGQCAVCAAALAEARGLAAAASRVIATLDLAPAAAAKPAPPVLVKSSVPGHRVARLLIFRLPYARAAALLLLVGGTAFVVDRTGGFARGKRSQGESLMADVGRASEVAPPATAQAPPPAAVTSLEVTAEADFSGAAGSVRSVPSPEPAPAAVTEQRDYAGVTAISPQAGAAVAAKDAASDAPQAAALPVAPPAPPPARQAMRLEEVLVAGVSAFAPTVSRYRTREGAILTLVEEPLRTTFSGESTAARQSAAPQPHRRQAAAMAAPAINSYRWASPERGKTYTLSGPLSVAELEALSKRLAELERLP